MTSGGGSDVPVSEWQDVMDIPLPAARKMTFGSS
jgi:hypothetical protein